MHRAFVMIPILALPLLAGCATSNYVPLVYVSAATFGINAGGGTPDTPGAKVVIGFHSVDAAIVPVAILRDCIPTEDKDCADGEAHMSKVLGSSTQDDAAYRAALDAALVQTDRAREALETKQADQRLAEAAVRDASAAKDRQASLQTQLEALPEPAAAAPGTGIAGADMIAAPATTDAHAAERKELTGQLDKAKQEAAGYDAKKTRLTNAEKEVGDAKAALERQQGVTANLTANPPATRGVRSDALSVYGSFNGSAGSTGSNGASLNLGKSFSTGVAAQQLTDGLGKAAARSALRDCIAAVEKATPDVNARVAPIAACARTN